MLSLLTFFGCEQPTPLSSYDSGLPPAVPENLRVTTASDGIIILNWWKNIDPEYESYKLYRGVNDSLNLVFYKDLRTNFFRDDGLFYDSTYYFALSAVGRNGKESKKAFFKGVKPVNNFDPVLPAFIDVKSVNYEGRLFVSFEWSRDENPDLKGLEVYRSTSPGFIPNENDFVLLLNDQSDTDSLALSGSTQYYYKFRAADKGGRFSEFSREYSTFLFPATTKLFPQNGAVIPLFDVFVVNAISYDLEYEIIVYESPTVSEIWRSNRYRKSEAGELFIPFTAYYLSLNKKYYWRVATYLPGSGSPVNWSDLSSFQISRYN